MKAPQDQVAERLVLRDDLAQPRRSGIWMTSPGVAHDPGQVEPLAGQQAQLAEEAVRAPWTAITRFSWPRP